MMTVESLVIEPLVKWLVMKMKKMIVVTEFTQPFQWNKVWTEERRLKNNVIVESVNVISYLTVELNSDIVGNADLIFVYCSRTCKGGEWFRLPLEVKKFMKPEAKMIVQFDSEFLWLINPDNAYWKPQRDLKQYKNISPKKFFGENGVLDVADAYFTVLENPFWARYCKKPIYYMPLPQLIRYKLEPLYNLERRNGTIALLRHSPRMAKIEHIVYNVANPLNKPVSIFTCSTSRSRKGCVEYIKQLKCSENSMAYGYLVGDSYINMLQKCYIGIDDAEGYAGWSRFTMECGLLAIPCVGSTYATKLFFPKLYTKHKDYVKQRELVQRLYEDKKFYKKVAEEGRKRVLEHLDSDKLCQRFVRIAKEIGV